MVSSVVTARLEYGCGHTALVSLPHIKGERQTQRTQRIAGEKAAAAARACDFCGPVTLVASDGATDADVTASLNGTALLNGTPTTNGATAQPATLPLEGMHEALEAAAESQPPAEERQDTEEPEQTEDTPLTSVAEEPVVAAQPEPERSEADTSQLASTEAGAPRRRTRGTHTQTETPRRRGRPPGSGRRARRTTQTQPLQPSTAQASQNGKARPPQDGRPEPVQDRTARPERPRRGLRTAQPTPERQFRVRFRVETVLDAKSVLEAIREVERRGATDVTAVIREG
jgi:hypothetical protein